MAYADIELKRNDTRPYLDSTLSDADGAVDLSGCTIKFFMEDADGTTIVSQTSTGSYVTLPDATAGEVRYAWQSTDSATGGHYKAEWQVTWGDGTKATFPNDGYLTVVVRDDLDST